MQRLIQNVSPAAADLILARVVEIGTHKHIELPAGQMSSLFPGDEIIVSFVNRYAADQ